MLDKTQHQPPEDSEMNKNRWLMEESQNLEKQPRWDMCVFVCTRVCVLLFFAQPRSRTVAWEARTSIESYILDHRKLEKEQIVSECRRWQGSGFQTGELKREIP